MKVSRMIQELQALQAEAGDVQVTITDGYRCVYYRGKQGVNDYFIDVFTDNGQKFIDIGIGGTEEKEEQGETL